LTIPKANNFNEVVANSFILSSLGKMILYSDMLFLIINAIRDNEKDRDTVSHEKYSVRNKL
jgi:hypothetical protein